MPTISLYNVLWVCVTGMCGLVVWMCWHHWHTMKRLEETLRARAAQAGTGAAAAGGAPRLGALSALDDLGGAGPGARREAPGAARGAASGGPPRGGQAGGRAGEAGPQPDSSAAQAGRKAAVDLFGDSAMDEEDEGGEPPPAPAASGREPAPATGTGLKGTVNDTSIDDLFAEVDEKVSSRAAPEVSEAEPAALPLRDASRSAAAASLFDDESPAAGELSAGQPGSGAGGASGASIDGPTGVGAAAHGAGKRPGTDADSRDSGGSAGRAGAASRGGPAGAPGFRSMFEDAPSETGGAARRGKPGAPRSRRSDDEDMASLFGDEPAGKAPGALSIGPASEVPSIPGFGRGEASMTADEIGSRMAAALSQPERNLDDNFARAVEETKNARNRVAATLAPERPRGSVGDEPDLDSPRATASAPRSSAPGLPAGGWQATPEAPASSWPEPPADAGWPGAPASSEWPGRPPVLANAEPPAVDWPKATPAFDRAPSAGSADSPGAAPAFDRAAGGGSADWPGAAPAFDMAAGPGVAGWPAEPDQRERSPRPAGAAPEPPAPPAPPAPPPPPVNKGSGTPARSGGRAPEPMLEQFHSFYQSVADEAPAPASPSKPGHASEVLRRVLSKARGEGGAAPAEAAAPTSNAGTRLMAEGRFAEATDFYTRRTETAAATEDDFRQLGKALANQGRMDAAVLAWERMHARFPGSAARRDELAPPPDRKTSIPGTVGAGKKLSFRKPSP